MGNLSKSRYKLPQTRDFLTVLVVHVCCGFLSVQSRCIVLFLVGWLKLIPGLRGKNIHDKQNLSEVTRFLSPDEISEVKVIVKQGFPYLPAFLSSA